VAATSGERFPKKKAGANVADTGSSTYQQSRTRVKLEAGKAADFSMITTFQPQQVVFDPDFKQLLRGRERAERKLSLQP
jgi:hypothetical protein